MLPSNYFENKSKVFDFWNSVYGDWVGWEEFCLHPAQQTFERQCYGTWLVLAAFCPLWVQRNAMQIYSFQMRLGPRVKIFQEKCAGWYFLLHSFSLSVRFSFPLNFFSSSAKFPFFPLDGRRHCGKDAKLDELLSGLERNNHLLSMSFILSLVWKTNPPIKKHHSHLVGAMTTRRMRAAVTMMLTRPYTTSTNVLTEEPGCKRQLFFQLYGNYFL